ncbi:42578_t:CDS:1 [Gigaspora margarita]|uniref:42578_t:CDS:1 n=1 Tax=Gigaspora margarita TaxID=4874 RepID=A0ABN7URM6_GIGMA|nr:42578_t:CDS:1 [Gigaspora margarita]
MNPRTLVNIIDAEKLLLLNSNDASMSLLEPNVITSSHIIGVSNNQLWIQNLVENEKDIDEFKDNSLVDTYSCDEFKVNSLVDTYSCGEEIIQITKHAANDSSKKKHVGCLYAWIVKVTNEIEVLLIAWKYDHEMLVWNKIGDTIQIINNQYPIKYKLLESETTIQIIYDNNPDTIQIIVPVEFKLLRSEDLIMILFGGIYIWTAKTDKGIHLLNYWDELQLYDFYWDELEFYDLESYNSHFVKSPRFGQILKNMNETNVIMYKNIRTNECFKYENLLECYVEDL